MKFNLNIPERIALLNILPSEGNLVTLKIIRELQNDLSFSEAEMQRFKIKVQKMPDGVRTALIWDEKFNTETKEINIGGVALGIIVDQLKALESRKKLRLEMLDLYEKFVKKADKLKSIKN